MNRLLEGLDRKAEVYLIGRNVFAYVGQIGRLDAIEENQKREYLVVGRLLGFAQNAVVFDILTEVNLLGNPEVIHRRAVPIRYPRVLYVVEVV